MWGGPGVPHPASVQNGGPLVGAMGPLLGGAGTCLPSEGTIPGDPGIWPPTRLPGPACPRQLQTVPVQGPWAESFLTVNSF